MRLGSPTYRIVDEPVRSRWDHLAVGPSGPLLALMTGGAWLSLPWSVFNGFALGSPTRARDAWLVAAGFAGSAIYAVAVSLAIRTGLVHVRHYEWFALILTLWKLFLAYFLFEHQSRSASLREYFGGTLRNGAGLAFVVGLVGRGWILNALSRRDEWVLYMVLS